MKPKVVHIAGFGAAKHLSQQGYSVILLDVSPNPGGLSAGWRTKQGRAVEAGVKGFWYQVHYCKAFQSGSSQMPNPCCSNAHTYTARRQVLHSSYTFLYICIASGCNTALDNAANLCWTAFPPLAVMIDRYTYSQANHEHTYIVTSQVQRILPCICQSEIRQSGLCTQLAAATSTFSGIVSPNDVSMHNMIGKLLVLLFSITTSLP